MRPRLPGTIALVTSLGLSLVPGLASGAQEDGTSSSTGQIQAPRAMTVDDVLNLARIRDVALSPDGQVVFYGVSELDWERNRRKTTYKIAPTDGGPSRTFLGAGGSSLRFSPDGTRVALIREVDDDDQIFVMHMAGGEAVQLTQHRGGVEDYRWAHDYRIIFTARELPDEETWKEHELGYDPVFVDEAPNGKNEEFFRDLWRADVETGEVVRLTDEDLVIGGFDVAPEGTIAFVARPDLRTNYPFLAELYLLEPGAEAPHRVTDNTAPESGLLWSPDGSKLLYRAPSDSGFDLVNGFFWVLDRENGVRRRLEAQRTGEIGEVAWSADGSSILFSEVHGTSTNLYRLDVATDSLTPVTNLPQTVDALGYSADGRRVIVGLEDFTTPRDLYALALGDDLSCPRGPAGCDLVRLTDVNPWVRQSRLVANGETMRWSSKGDMEIEGIFLPPIGGLGGEPSPMILEVHGGPAGGMGNRFEPELQVLSGLGYAVLAPNFRGSSGYGDALLQALIGEVGDGEFVDLMTGIDHAVATKNVDVDRLGIRGWSWGGVSSSYTITQTNRFKAASVGAMVGDWAAETGPGFNFDVSLWYIGGTPWDDPEEWARRSSITHVKNVTTPTIIFHGGRDETSSVGQSLRFFTALRDIGKAPVRYVKFPRQGHGVEEPRLLRALIVEEARWFKRYIEGIEWEPWKRGS